MKYTTTILLTILLQTLYAQAVEQDLQAINQAFLQHPNLTMDITYEVYKNQDDAAPYYVEQGKSWQKGDYKYQKIGSMETITGEDFSLFVSHEEKIINLLGLQRAAKEEQPIAAGLIPMDKIKEMSDKIDFQEEGEAHNSYTFSPKESEYSRVKVIYQKDNFFIRKIILDYKDEQDLEGNGQLSTPRFTITCSNIDTDPRFTEETFSYLRFLTKQSGELRCKPAYKGYQLQNSLFQ